MTIPLLAVVVGAAVVSLLAYGLTTKSTSRTLDDAVARGQRPLAPVEPLGLLSGNRRSSLAAYRGQVVVLNFWASWCDPCKAEAPLLERTQRQLAQHGGTVLGVTYLDATPDSRAFAAHYHLTYPSLRDVDGSFARSYGTQQLPETFVIDRKGRVVAISRGEIGSAFLDHALSVAQAT